MDAHDPVALEQWVENARHIAAASGHQSVCDSHIGRQFAFAPADVDGSWPCDAVRRVMERLPSEELDRGFILGVLNRQGAHFVGRDGALEARLAAQFRQWCERVRMTSPRTGALLRQLAEGYERDAKREIERGHIEEFDL